MFTTHFLVFSLLSVAFLTVHARPSIFGAAFVNQDVENYSANLTAAERSDAAKLTDTYLFVIKSGAKLTFNDYVNMAKNRYPVLYTKLAVYQKIKEEHENALPAKAKQFLIDRLAEERNVFANGEFHMDELMKNIRAIGRDVSKMTDDEKAALLKYYPHMQALLDNPHFQNVVNGSDDKDDLMPLF